MKLKRMSHMHAWMKDTDSHVDVYRDIMGLEIEERNFTPMGFPAFSSITGNGRDKVWIEWIYEAIPKCLAPITVSRAPHLMAIDYQVEDVDAAMTELKESGIEMVMEIPMGNTRQLWFEAMNGFYMELSQFEGDDLLEPLGIEQIPLCRDFVDPEDKLGIIKLDHATGWTENAVRAAEQFGSLFGFETSVTVDTDNQIKIARFNAPGDDVYWELFQKLGASSLECIDGWDTSGLFSICYQVKDLGKAETYLEEKGIKEIWRSNRNGKAHVMFSCEKTNGINIEICE